MVPSSWVPLCFAGYDALDITRGVPAPDLTGSPSALIVLVNLKNLLAVLSGGCGRLCAVGASAGQDHPGDPSGAIGRCHGHHAHRLALQQRRQPRDDRGRRRLRALDGADIRPVAQFARSRVPDQVLRQSPERQSVRLALDGGSTRRYAENLLGPSI